MRYGGASVQSSKHSGDVSDARIRVKLRVGEGSRFSR